MSKADKTLVAPWHLRAALLVLWAERLCVALWPALSVAMLIVAAALMGLPALLPAWLHAALLLVAVAAIVFLARRGWRPTARPALHAAERRLERDSGLRHRPFAVLRDRPATGGPAELALWQLHRDRAAAAITRLRLKGPDPALAAQDPFALRAAAGLVLVAGLVVAGPQAGSNLARLFAPGLSNWRNAASPMVQAWIQPPSYTGLPPVFLPSARKDSSVITVPAGSRLTVSITGLAARPDLSFDGTTQHLESLGNDSFQASLVLTKDGRLRIGTFFSDLAAWDLAVLPNEKPVVAWQALPGRAGTSVSTKLPWQVQQRWGVAALQAEMRPQGHPDLPSLTVPLPLPGTPKQAKGAASPDLSSNPYSGLTLTARLVARDVSGQQGSSDTVDFVLPARAFRHPLARAIADLRRRLALHPDSAEEAAADLAALAQAPFSAHDPSGLPASGVTLNLAAAAALLTGSPANIAEAQARLWTLALALDGALPDSSARALTEAREKLRQGLEERQNGRLSQKDLDKRLDALREALDKRLADIARQAMQKGAIEKFDPRSQHLSSNAMDRMIRKMEQAAREGRMDEARQRMAELEKMLDQLKSAHIMSKQEAQQRQEQARRGRQMMGAVQDIVRRETGLLDHSEARTPPALPNLPPQFRTFEFPQANGTEEPQQEEPDPPMAGLPPEDNAPGEPPRDQTPQSQTPAETPGHSPPPGTRAEAQAQDSRIQRALHRALDAMSQAFVESGGKKPPNLDEAGRAMDEAAQALAHRQDPVARDAIGRAIAALQQGGQNMAQQMSSPSAGQMQLSLEPGSQAGAGEGQEGEDEPDDGQGGRKKDPFGRQVDGNGTAADDPNLRVPDEMEQGRSRAIQEELRRRGADRGRPQEELNYIGRLLKPF